MRGTRTAVKVKVGDLRKVIREEAEYTEAMNELFGKKADFGSMMDNIMQDLQNTTKKIEKAHQAAPQGAAKAIVAGLHSDLFNKISEFRKYVEQLKKLSAGGSQPTKA